MNLLYYAKERSVYPLEFANKLTIKQADAIIKKLIRHYKLDSYNRWKYVGVSSSRCITNLKNGKPNGGYFRFSRTELSIGVICHELAHALEMIRYEKSGHTKRHFNIMKRLINYCHKHNYGNNDIIMAMSGQELQERQPWRWLVEEYQ